MTDRLNEIAARHGAATKGPWDTTDAHGENGEFCFSQISNEEGITLASTWIEPHQANAAFIAASWSDIEYLLSEVRRLRAERDGLLVSPRRYETVRRLNVPAFKALVEANIKVGKPFDQLVDEIASFVWTPAALRTGEPGTE